MAETQNLFGLHNMATPCMPMQHAAHSLVNNENEMTTVMMKTLKMFNNWQ
jgi:hypothetical protein